MASEFMDRALFDFDDFETPTLEGSPFKRLFGVWRDLHERLKSATADADKLLDAQTSLMSMAAHLPANSPEDVLYKLAFWRWDSSDLEADFSSLQRGDQIVYSAFRDLATLTDDRNVLMDVDVASNYLSAAPKPA